MISEMPQIAGKRGQFLTVFLGVPLPPPQWDLITTRATCAPGCDIFLGRTLQASGLDSIVIVYSRYCRLLAAY